MLLEIFSYLDDHRDFIEEIPHIGDYTNGTPHIGEPLRTMWNYNVQRSTVIRNLTLTCRLLRNVLLPVLWKDVEGCVVINPGYPRNTCTYGLYHQCEYLLLNPAVAAYVQCVSSFLSPENSSQNPAPPGPCLWT